MWLGADYLASGIMVALDLPTEYTDLSISWNVWRSKMNIGSVAKAAGLPVKTVRYYADIGLVSPVARSDSGYRQYTNNELSKLVFARRARAFGFSIEETRELLALYEDRDRSSADVKSIATGKLAEIESKMADLQALHDELSHLVHACRGDNRPDCPIIAGFATSAT